MNSGQVEGFAAESQRIDYRSRPTGIPLLFSTSFPITETADKDPVSRVGTSTWHQTHLKRAQKTRSAANKKLSTHRVSVFIVYKP